MSARLNGGYERLLIIVESFQGGVSSLAWATQLHRSPGEITILVKESLRAWVPEKFLLKLFSGCKKVNVLVIPDFIRIRANAATMGELVREREALRAELDKLEAFLLGLIGVSGKSWAVVGGNSALFGIIDSIARKRHVKRFSHGLSDELYHLSWEKKFYRGPKNGVKALAMRRKYWGSGIKPESSFIASSKSVSFRPEFVAVFDALTREHVGLETLTPIIRPDVFLVIPEGGATGAEAAEMVARLLTSLPSRFWRVQGSGPVSVVVKQHPRMAAEFKIEDRLLEETLNKSVAKVLGDVKFGVIASNTPAELAIALMKPCRLIGTVSTTLLNAAVMYPSLPIVLVELFGIEAIYGCVSSESKTEHLYWQTKLSAFFGRIDNRSLHTWSIEL